MHRFGLSTPPYSADDGLSFPVKRKMMDAYSASANPDATVAELCAQTVCFLWFESLPTLNEAATIGFTNTRIPSPDSFAKPEFIKWTKNVLHTTQVSTNVVILAMLYIFRLKLANPGVKGKAGSEFRLLTVALMLGNKYLDDNTYTNKTWSEVTQINVKEIHLMEVEFLSNMRYSLLVTVDAWQEWLVKINAFVQYQQRQQSLHTGTGLVGLPSPPMLYEFSQAGLLHPSLLTPLQTQPGARKRSFEEDFTVMLPPAKVISLPTTPRRTFAMTTRSKMQERSPHRRQQSLMVPVQQQQPPQQQQQLLRGVPRALSTSGKQLSLPPLHLAGYNTGRLSPMQYSRTGSGHAGTTTSPTGSSASRFSLDSAAFHHGPTGGTGHASGTATPTTMAMQHRHSPYGPVYQVQRLVRPLPAVQMGRLVPQQQQWATAGQVPPQQLVYHTLGAGMQPHGQVGRGVLPQQTPPSHGFPHGWQGQMQQPYAAFPPRP
ncbi:hypothetical protein BCR37DRAFT_383752 [Protomyces lactucae-debilis]|uniref:Cyclin-domain-containing protein n=1 Tax=Protomyces lactucae-debilis TaxID=2754530 RepID=A0A1Y2EX63_PROLT|nr:uncharacterized protein BCR37DRAFT_383752 [Protomyces lactucae-debilis]ORY76087.1 hypothetical protein BCR37DRAFT_383752 [Protomyces lactucae-debilis]